MSAAACLVGLTGSRGTAAAAGRSAAAGRGHPAPRLTRAAGTLGELRCVSRLKRSRPSAQIAQRKTSIHSPNILLSIRLAPPVPNILVHPTTEQTLTLTRPRPASASSMLDHLLTCSNDLAGPDCDRGRPATNQVDHARRRTGGLRSGEQAGPSTRQTANQLRHSPQTSRVQR